MGTGGSSRLPREDRKVSGEIACLSRDPRSLLVKLLCRRKCERACKQVRTFVCACVRGVYVCFHGPDIPAKVGLLSPVHVTMAHVHTCSHGCSYTELQEAQKKPCVPRAEA